MVESLTSKRMTDRELLRSCMEAMYIAHRVQGARTDWSLMIEDIRRHLESSAHETTGCQHCETLKARVKLLEGETSRMFGELFQIAAERRNSSPEEPVAPPSGEVVLPGRLGHTAWCQHTLTVELNFKEPSPCNCGAALLAVNGSRDQEQT